MQINNLHQEMQGLAKKLFNTWNFNNY